MRCHFLFFTHSQDVSNPFYEDYATESAPGKSNIETSILEEDWVKELMEDLDVFIAERNFEDAVDSIEKVSSRRVVDANVDEKMINVVRFMSKRNSIPFDFIC